MSNRDDEEYASGRYGSPGRKYAPSREYNVTPSDYMKMIEIIT